MTKITAPVRPVTVDTRQAMQFFAKTWAQRTGIEASGDLTTIASKLDTWCRDHRVTPNSANGLAPLMALAMERELGWPMCRVVRHRPEIALMSPGHDKLLLPYGVFGDIGRETTTPRFLETVDSMRADREQLDGWISAFSEELLPSVAVRRVPEPRFAPPGALDRTALGTLLREVAKRSNEKGWAWVTVEEFFAGNGQSGSFGDPRRFPQEPQPFYQSFRQIEARGDVAGLSIAVRPSSDPDAWPRANQVVLLTSAPVRHVWCWLPAELEPDELEESTFDPEDLPFPVPAGMRPVVAIWA